MCDYSEDKEKSLQYQPQAKPGLSKAENKEEMMQSWAKGVALLSARSHQSLATSVGKQGLKPNHTTPASKWSQQKGKLLYKEPVNS